MDNLINYIDGLYCRGLFAEAQALLDSCGDLSRPLVAFAPHDNFLQKLHFPHEIDADLRNKLENSIKNELQVQLDPFGFFSFFCLLYLASPSY